MANSPGQPEDFVFPGEFLPSPRSQDCSKKAGGWGVPMTDFEYIWYGNASQSDYPDDACLPLYHKAAQIDNIQVNAEVTGGAVNMTGDVKSNNGGHVLSNKKNLPFDMPHPNKKGWRLRHVCVEGPTADVMYRGRMKDTNIINLPEYWIDLVDPETITVHLTPIGSFQPLYYKELEWGKKFRVYNSDGGPINCSFVIYGERVDGERNIPEYEGLTPLDYPGDNTEYNVNK